MRNGIEESHHHIKKEILKEIRLPYGFFDKVHGIPPPYTLQGEGDEKTLKKGGNHLERL
jgi:hypothetical protein